MKLGIYSIRDVKTGYLTPMVDQNDQCAIRGFEHAIMQKNNLYYSHSKDYDLFRIGTFDAETGTIVPETPVLLLEGAFVKGAIDNV